MEKEINGWFSNLTKNTASARVNFSVGFTDSEVESITKDMLMKELQRKGRSNEANPDIWTLKEPINRDYQSLGKTTARIRFRKI